VPRTKRALIWSAVVAAIVVLALTWAFGFQTATAIMVRYKSRGIPEAHEIPVPLGDISVADTGHRRVSFGGYSFELPEDDGDDARSRRANNIEVTAFRSGNALWFSKFPPRSFIGGIEKEMKVSASDIARSYGATAARSDYDFYAAVLNMTPEKLSPFESGRQSARDSLLLMIKLIVMPRADTGLFSIQENGWRGFQFGDPRKGPPRIADELYSDAGGVDFIFFRKNGASGAGITQARINRVLASLSRESTQADPHNSVPPRKRRER